MRTNLSIILLLFVLSCKKSENIQNRTPEPLSKSLGVMYYYSNYSYSTLNPGNLFAFDLDSEKYLWGVGVPNISPSNILYDNGIIYTCDNYGIAAVDARTGTRKWDTQIGDRALQLYGPGISTAPVVADSFVYFTSIKGTSDHAILNALNKNDGRILWQKDLSENMSVTQFYYNEPAIADDKIIAVSCDGSKLDRIYCLNRFTGEQIWQNTSPLYSFAPFPVINDEKTKVFIQTNNEKAISSFDIRNGSLLWTIPTSAQINFGQIQIWNKKLFFFNGSPRTPYYSVDQNGENWTEISTPDNLSHEFNNGDIYSIDLQSQVSRVGIDGLKWNRTLSSKTSVDTVMSLNPVNFILKTSPIVVDNENITMSQVIGASDTTGLGTIFFKFFIYSLNKNNGNIVKEVKFDLLSLIHSSSYRWPPIYSNFIIVKDNQPYYSNKGFVPYMQ